MKKKLKLFKFITNIIAFSSLSLSVFGPLWHFQNTKSYSDFKLETRDIDLSNSKKPVNFDDLVQIVSAKNQQNSLVINANIKKAKTHLNKTSTNSDSPSLDDIEIQINQEGEVILNSSSLELVNKKAELYFEEGVPKLKLEGHVFDFRELQNKTRVEKTAAPAAVVAAPAAFSGLFWYAIGAAIVGIAAAYIFPNIVSDVGRWWNNNRSAHPVHKDDDSPIIRKNESSIVVDLGRLPKEKGKSTIKTKAKAKAERVKLSIIRDKERLRRYTGIHLAWFFNFRTKGLQPYFVISEEEISENQAWVLAVGSLLAQSKLTQIVIDNLLPNLTKGKIDKADRNYIKEKLNSPIDFYSYNESVMKTLAIKTKDTANLIVRNERLVDPNNNLNKDSGFTKDNFVVGEDLVNDVIDWTDSKNKFDVEPSRSTNEQPYVKIYFPSYHVRRLRMIGDKDNGIKSEFLPRKKC
ncbi:hypothetical protein PWA39_03935 [Mesomycoplasma ovipneumoniae ATCC 29419]|uniref:hypothetical protein n=1 Tax=Mesomycoplasma ovipneumoniae TaxID=29562 RepID=UPI00237FC61A|nr:hypothetical protein [Mesomycoplasma ovipneumoniae]WDV48656.1 hypothetical protein PWA39_03935 [Mesomycoplasma ovipneumoniae ATCC 29419]